MIKGPLHNALKPLSWLVGNWKSISAKAKYPTMEPMSYCEEISFTSVGQPILNYRSMTWHAIKKNPMHLESGFLRVNPENNEAAFMIAHSLGMNSLEEGTIGEYSMQFKSTEISTMSFVKPPAVTGIERKYRLNDDGKLELTLYMATEVTTLTEHLKVVYEKID